MDIEPEILETFKKEKKRKKDKSKDELSKKQKTSKDEEQTKHQPLEEESHEIPINGPELIPVKLSNKIEDENEIFTETLELNKNEEAEKPDTETDNLPEDKLKKIADFNAKNFRQLLLNKQTCYGALKDFIEICSIEKAKRDFALEYLENGGNTLEIIRVIEIAENKTASFALPIIEALTIVIIKIISAHPQKQMESEEYCREFINKHYSVIKAMIILSSSPKQKKSALKLLSAIVSLSASTAKEVLLHAVFDEDVLKILNQPSNVTDGSSVRTYFIHYLMSFLVDGHTPVIIAFLEKRNLLTSIFPGLIYDTEDIVSLVLSTIQTKILEDIAISKTIKMTLFHTKNIHILINLYNWKGPGAWDPKKRKENRVTSKTQNTKLLDTVHTFLLCLCASKHGIIFFDPSIGLSLKTYNPLLVTVLRSLLKPWTSEYKKDLVIKICVACPDLVKVVLMAADVLLEPRISNNWLSAIRFVQELMASLTATSIEQFLVDLHYKQVSLVMQQLCVPKSVLVKIAEGLLQDYLIIRYECVHLLNIMLNSADTYLKFTKNKSTVKNSFSMYLNINLPPGSVLLNDWYTSIKTEHVDESKLNQYLTVLLDVLYQYTTFCPDLVENITKNIDVKEFLDTIKDLSEKDANSCDLHIKAINLLISCDITVFAPSEKIFSYTLPILFNLYYNTVGETQIEIEGMLFALFKLTGVFDNCMDEIMIWLYSFLDQPIYDEHLVKCITNVLAETSNDYLLYSNDMTILKEQLTEDYNYRIILENLSSDTKNTIKLLNTQNKHRVLSPFILGFFDFLLQEPEINIKSYLNASLMNLLHFQTNPMLFLNIVLQEKYTTILSPKLQKYFSNWKLNKITASKKGLCPEDSIHGKLIYFLAKGEISEMLQFIEYFSEYSKYYTNTIMTNLIMFYYTQKSIANSLTSSFQLKCYELLIHIINKSDEQHLKECLKSIFEHPSMLDSFNPTSTNNNESSKLSTDFVINIIKELLRTKTKQEIEIYLSSYRMKLVDEINQLFENYAKSTAFFETEHLMDTIQLFNLSYDNRNEILNILSKISVTSFKSDESKSSLALKFESYILEHKENYLKFKPFPNEVLKQINQQMIELNNSGLNLNELELSLFHYISHYSHANINFDDKLFESLITKQTTTKSTVRLATVLLQKSPKYLEIFMKYLDGIYDKRELVFSLINCVMKMKTDQMKILFEKVFKQYEQIIMKYLYKPQKAANYLVDNYQVVIKLIVEQLKQETCNEFCAKNHKFDATESHHFEALTTIFNKTIMGKCSEDLKQKYVRNYVTTSMNLLINLLKRATKTEDDWNKAEKIAKQFSTYVIKVKNVYKIELNDDQMFGGAVFQTFAKLSLKFGLQDKPIFVHVLKQVCSLASEKSNIAGLGLLFEMAIAHSESLNILLSEDEKKAPLLGLLLAVCTRCKSVMIKSHIPIWLSAYGATLSETDQYLLQLLSLYESANIGFHEFRPYLWGKAAVAHYSVRSNIGTTLWRQPKPKEVLDLFDENRIIHTIQHFPWSRRLHNDSLYSDSDIEVYDPAFYLPLLSHLLASESTILWYHCTVRGVISLPIIALTSENDGIRAAACNVLARFHAHLEAANYAKQRFMWLRLIEAICRGTSILPSLRPCTIVAVFLARCSIVYSRPDDPVYSTLGSCISAKECPNFNIVPELLTMLHSTDVKHDEHRNFILEVIRDGLCTDEDLMVLYKSVAFKLIMDLYNSVLINFEGKKIILEILAAAVSLQNGAKTLVFSYNLISWLHAVAQQLKNHKFYLLYLFIKILNNLITTLEDELSKHLQFHILLMLVSVIDSFKSSKLELKHLVKYIQVLYKVYDMKPYVLSKTQLLDLISMASQLNCQICNYYIEFGDDFVETPILLSDDDKAVGRYYLEKLTLKWIQTNKDL